MRGAHLQNPPKIYVIWMVFYFLWFLNLTFHHVFRVFPFLPFLLWTLFRFFFCKFCWNETEFSGCGRYKEKIKGYLFITTILKIKYLGYFLTPIIMELYVLILWDQKSILCVCGGGGVGVRKLNIYFWSLHGCCLNMYVCASVCRTIVQNKVKSLS